MYHHKKNLQTLIFLVSLFSIVHSTSMFEVGLQELATTSQKIVQGQVTDVVTRWNKDSTVIYTYIRMNIEDDLIGADEDNEIIIKQVGGQMGLKTLQVEGTTHYQAGEENVLFLFQDPENLACFQTLGMYQGKYNIYTDANGVQRVTQDTTVAVTLYRSRGDTSAVETGNNFTLEEFKTSVINYANEK